MPDESIVQEWGEPDWESLLLAIKFNKCTPFLGAGACFGLLPLGADIAQHWAQEYNFPLENSNDLARVAQFMATMYDPRLPKFKIAKQFGNVPSPDFSKPDEPHGLLAMLPLPVYITTNYDSFMVQALQTRNKDPQQEICLWNDDLKKKYKSKLKYQPTVQRPLVYHLHGYIGLPESLVLFEDDYLEFLWNMSQEPDLIPSRIQDAFTDTSLLFLGYQLADWDFRVLFRSLTSYLSHSTTKVHVSVQLLPLEQSVTESQTTKARAYLNQYFKNLNVKVYWGNCHTFVAELRKRWEDPTNVK